MFDLDTNKDGKLDTVISNACTWVILAVRNLLKSADFQELIDWNLMSQNRLYFRTVEDTNKDSW
jgi:hypothetical protein